MDLSSESDWSLAEDMSPLERSLVALQAPTAPQDSVVGALERCLVGRRAPTSLDTTRMPPYNLGYGYICDSLRRRRYQGCLKTEGQTAASCATWADDQRTQCRKSPCEAAYEECKQSRCTRDSNDWECWVKRGKDWAFGYYDWRGLDFQFLEVATSEVDESTWEQRCLGLKNRCEQSLSADAGSEVAPADRSFLSAAVYGHNCHHATEQVCDCVNSLSSNADAFVLVLDGSGGEKPNPPGNVYHSLLVVNHPSKPKHSCLIESQWPYAAQGIDERCCYETGTEYEALPKAGCPHALSGPARAEMQMSPYSTYGCETFFERRGIEPGQEPATYWPGTSPRLANR